MNDDIQQLILDTYKSHPKHFTRMLSRNSEVVSYVTNKCVGTGIITFLEQLYYSVYGENRICPNGNIKQLKTFGGYSFCGKAGVCKCAKESVSKSVSAAKQLYSDETNNAINKKREGTSLKLYGVKNNGQTIDALSGFKAFYADKQSVDTITKQIKATKLENHGNETYNNRTKAEETCLSRYGVKSTWSLTTEKQNPNLDILRDKTRLSEIFPRLSVDEIASTYSIHAQTVYYYLNLHGLRTPYKSTFEQELIHYINSLGVTNIITNKRTIIGKELDIFLPDFNLAIEYNGVYWHHDKINHITKSYHYDKFIDCEKKGIELFTIFSDSWESKKSIWKEKIKAKLKLCMNKIYARKTNIVSLSSAETRYILDTNHVQGYCVAQYCYGLMYDGELVAAMTFSRKRVGIGKDRGPTSYELVRYVTSKTVIGGASKLLSHFIKIMKPTVIVSYSDNQYSIGDMYNKLGFELEKTNAAGYKYYNSVEKKMYHRFKFAKHSLVKQGFDSSKTEFEIMDERGFLRIWDCGTRTWVLNLTDR